MSKIKEHVEKFSKHRISTIVRTNDYDHALKIIEGSYNGGIRYIEITLTTPNAYKLITESTKKWPELEIGAGTVMTQEEAIKAIDAGATYLVSPTCNLELLKWCNDKDILLIASGMTPTEMYELHKNGAEIIKLFPASFGGPKFAKMILNPFPMFKLLATAGPNKTNLDDFYQAGVFGCGITEDLGGAPIGTSIEEISIIAKKYVEIAKKYIK